MGLTALRSRLANVERTSGDNVEDPKQIDEDKKKELAKAIYKSRLDLFFTISKTIAGLFLANLATIAVAKYYLVDVDPEGQAAFLAFTPVLNILFGLYYFDRKLRDNKEALINKTKEILNK